jgi:SPP1 family predicted phage head-tail adaptor
VTTASIGSLRTRLTLEQASRLADDGGGATVTWQLVAELWGAVRPITGDERLRADKVSGRVTHEIALRYRADVAPAMRLRDGTRVFAIVAVLDAGRRNRLKCLCEERDL